jgi:alkanesulfonate monooxygenase SsuD/methylene tetrahydromethanopterin reductase-like flavin-dependent oxidoreductase (luciferase family)
MDFGLYLEFASREGVPQHEVFRESFALVDEAERLGVDSMWLAEYHFTVGRSVLSAPVPIACAIASRTARARIGLAVLLLPLGHPIRIAEEVATLDHISQGRLEFGIGRGTFPNVHEGFRVTFTESRRRFEEYLDIILKAWTTKSLSYEGEYFSCQEVTVAPKPYYTPYPPISVGITSAETFPIIGRKGYAIIINPSRVFALSELAPHIQGYRQVWKEAGHPHAHLTPPMSKGMYVTPTMEEALHDPLDLDNFSSRILRSTGTTGAPIGMPTDKDGNLPPGYEAWASRQRDRERRDDPGHAGLPPLRGTPEVIIERLKQTQEAGVERIFGAFGFPGLPQWKVLRSIELFCTEVLPHFRAVEAPVAS